MSEIILRPATVDDAAEMLAIYAPYVIQTTVSSVGASYSLDTVVWIT